MKCHVVWRHLVNSKANSLKVAVKPFVSSSILLHQPQQKSASILLIQRIIIHVLQMHHELRVRCECGWKAERTSLILLYYFGHTIKRLSYLHNWGSLQLWIPLSTSLHTGSGSSGPRHHSQVRLGSGYRSPAWKTARWSLNRTSWRKERILFF